MFLDTASTNRQNDPASPALVRLDALLPRGRA